MPKGLLPLVWLVLVSTVVALPTSQDAPKPASDPAVGIQGGVPPPARSAAESVYLQLRTVDLAKSRVYLLRDVSIDRAAIHITLNDGTIAFTQDVIGRVTGAFFEGEGELLLSPPNQYERASMALFTGGAILEERFSTAYFRFNDDTFNELRPSMVSVDDGQAFLSQWNETARNLSEGDALRLFLTFSKFLPVAGKTAEDNSTAVKSENGDDRFLHARLQGLKLGTFDLFFDTDAPEQVSAGQLKTVEGTSYYDVWTSFATANANPEAEAVSPTVGEGGKPDAIAISQHKIRTEVKPPTEIDAEARLQMEVRHGGQRAVLFELSRALQIKKVEADGHPIEFIHNPATEGTQLARHANDLVAVVFPQPLRAGQRLELRFV